MLLLAVIKYHCIMYSSHYKYSVVYPFSFTAYNITNTKHPGILHVTCFYQQVYFSAFSACVQHVTPSISRCTGYPFPVGQTSSHFQRVVSAKKTFLLPDLKVLYWQIINNKSKLHCVIVVYLVISL